MEESVRARLPRRVIHLSSAGLLSYYLLPPDMYGAGFPRELVVLAFLVPVLAVEAYRWAGRRKLPGLRENEDNRISAVAWGAAGLAVAIVLFPQKLVVPCALGMAFVDPLIGELRLGWPKGYPYLPLAAYYLICFSAGLGWLPSLLATVVALAAEAPKVPQVDDDFRMLVAPLAALWLLALVFGWGPEPRQPGASFRGRLFKGRVYILPTWIPYNGNEYGSQNPHRERRRDHLRGCRT